ncbi:rhodanese-like domain-containing protein [Desulfovibrio sp. TomC]|uniref:rhodanese-like domain-containing protein n=1 Tax=Desulfovibrio sp. TomC TaxID=1562888 RepID=UPI0009E5B349|nr:rhodanese-like domain-containing protein [Desulfovibrio sp. TomC]
MTIKRHIVLAIFFLLGLSSLALADVQNCDTETMKSVISENANNKNFVVIDVSPTVSYESSHLEGAISLPAESQNFEENIQKLDKNKSYLVYCHKMKWTPKAIEVMKRNGFENLFASAEGKEGWMKAGNSVVTQTANQLDTKSMKKFIAENKANDNFVILDVSPAPAFAQRHIDGAINMPANHPDFEKNIQMMDKSKTYLVYCFAGRWTPQAITFMKSNGFKNVIASSEGLSGWEQAGNNVVLGDAK